MMCQKGFICIQGNCRDFGVKGTRNLTFYQNLDFFQRLLAHTFCNRVLMCAKMNRNSWKGLKFMDNIVHSIGTCIHTKRTCSTKPTHNCTDKRSWSWCKLANQVTILEFLIFFTKSFGQKIPILDMCQKNLPSFWTSRFEPIHCD